jgi:DNA-directed RNA polymerase subunit RPC12/RpoP
MTELLCSVCGKSAQYNTPCIDDEGNIICERCRENFKDGKMRRGIEQHRNVNGLLESDGSMHFFLNKGVVAFYNNSHAEMIGKEKVRLHEPMYSISAYTDYGRTTFPLNRDEKLDAIANPKAALLLIDMYNMNCWFRCTTCGKRFDEHEVAGRPLFAGKVCKTCWDLHLEYLEDERKKGNVCRMCGQPYGNCCC